MCFYIYSVKIADFATAEWQLFSIVKKSLHFSDGRIWVNSCGVNPLGLCEGFWGNFHGWDELRSLIFFHGLHEPVGEGGMEGGRGDLVAVVSCEY